MTISGNNIEISFSFLKKYETPLNFPLRLSGHLMAYLCILHTDYNIHSPLSLQACVSEPHKMCFKLRGGCSLLWEVKEVYVDMLQDIGQRTTNVETPVRETAADLS